MSGDLFSQVQVPCHSSVRLSGEKIIYVDPFRIEGEPHDGDLILLTHDHFDHFSPEDIQKVEKPDTFFVLPASVEPKGLPRNKILKVKPGDQIRIQGVWISAVPAYNTGKNFHPKSKQWVGYVVELDGLRYYIAGDTDAVPELDKISCDVALLPVGGTYTMTAEEAAAFCSRLRPRGAVPTHYGSVAGTAEDGKRFLSLLPADIEGQEKI